MSNPVAVRRTEINQDGEVLGGAVWVWCPGCDMAHRFQVDSNDPNRTQWDWDGDLELPTFEPSYLTWHKEWDQDGRSEDHRCHSYLRAGQWEFLSDSTHALAGKTVSMVPLPDWLVVRAHAGDR